MQPHVSANVSANTRITFLIISRLPPIQYTLFLNVSGAETFVESIALQPAIFQLLTFFIFSILFYIKKEYISSKGNKIKKGTEKLGLKQTYN